MNIETLLAAIPKTKFVQEYLHRLPFSLAGATRSVCRLGSWEVIGEILGQEGVDVMVVRDGQQYAGTDPRTLEDAKRLSAEGYTILVRHAESHHKQLNPNFPDDSADFGMQFAPIL